MKLMARNLSLAFTAVIAMQFGFSSVAHGDLIGYWPFDEVAEVDGEMTTPDTSPDGGHAGVLSESTELVEDEERGTVVSFGEFNNMAVVELPSFPQNEEMPDSVFEDRGPGFNAIVDSQEVTISFWQNRVGDDATDQWTFLFQAGARQLGSHAPWSNGQVYFDVSGCCGGNQRINTSMNGADTDGGWHHLAFVKEVNRDESDKAITAIFQDGQALVSSPGCDLACWDGGRGDLVDWSAATIDDVVPITSGAIGGAPGGGSSQNGLMDDFAIWDQALSTERIVGLSQGAGVIPIPEGETLGDFNSDDAIDSADFMIIAASLNERFSLEDAFFNGDMDGNLRVNLKDFLAFRELYSGQAAGAASIPEPSTGLLLAFAALGLLGFRRK